MNKPSQNESFPLVEKSTSKKESSQAKTRDKLTQITKRLTGQILAAVALNVGADTLYQQHEPSSESAELATLTERQSDSIPKLTELIESRIGADLHTDTVDVLRNYLDHSPMIDQYAEIAKRPETPRATIEGFEQIGLSSEQVNRLLTAITPTEWLSDINVSSVTVAQKPGERSYQLTGDNANASVLARCTSSRGLGEPSTVTLFSETLLQHTDSATPEQIRDKVLFTLIHEIAHANEPLTSSTMDRETRLSSMQWVMQRIQPMPISDSESIQNIEAKIHTFRSSQALGDGAMPFSYPFSINNQDPSQTEIDNARTNTENRYVEYYAETMASVLTLRFEPDPSRPWDRQAAEALLLTNAHVIGSPVLGESTRTPTEALEDALEHIHFVQRQIPDLEQRHRAFTTILEGTH